MSKYNKYVQIGQPAANAPANEIAMVKVLEKYPDVVGVFEDLGGPGMDWLKKNAPERIVECGIAEANAAVIAGALAAEGFRPFIHGFTFACIGRAYNQIRQSVLVDHFNVKFLGRESWGELGVSHQAVEGIGSLRIAQSRNHQCRRFCRDRESVSCHGGLHRAGVLQVGEFCPIENIYRRLSF